MSDCIDRDGNCTEPSDDGLPAQCVGRWVEEKHIYVKRYVEATRKVRKGYLGASKGGAAFVDLFAGPGRARIRETGQFVKGSPFLALDQTEAPFSRVVLCDLSTINVAALKERTKSDATRVDIVEGDCNVVVDQLVQSVPVYGLNMAFVDPYGLSQLAFETIRALAHVARMDLIIHFPTGTIKRNFHQNEADLDRFLGTRDWRSTVKTAQDAHKLIDVLRSQLATVGYTGADVRDIAVENAKHTVMYYLVFASKNRLGAMMSGAHRDTLTVQKISHFLRGNAVQHE